jgi:glutamine transport system substrate-binding protein
MSIMRKLGLLLMVLVLAFSLSACGSKQAENGDAKKVLVVGTDTSFVPFEFLNQDTGKYEGFDIDLWAAIAEELDLEYEIKPMDFNGLIPALQAKSIDVALAGMTIKEERKEKVDFAVPYYDAGLLVLVKADNDEILSVDDLDGKVIATKTGTTSYDFSVTVEGVKEVKPFPNIDGAYMELLNGGADAVIFDSPSVLYYYASKGKDKVKPVGDILDGQQYGIAFPKGSALLDDVNEVLEKLFENGKYDEIYEKWFGMKPTGRPAAS